MFRSAIEYMYMQSSAFYFKILHNIVHIFIDYFTFDNPATNITTHNVEVTWIQ